MNRSQRKDLFRLIRATRSRFFSLTAIVTLGVAFFVGVSAISSVMAYSVDVYDDDYALKDITVYSAFGFDEADVDAVRRMDEVADAEGSKFVDVNAVSGPLNYITRIHSWSEDMRINQFVLRSGRLPERPGEALAEHGTELIQGFPVGSSVKVIRPADDLDDWLVTDTFTIVGTIDTPVYLNQTKENSTLSNQYIRTYLYVPDAAFVPEYYTEMNVLTREGRDLDMFSDAYDNYDEMVKKRIEKLAETQADVRRNSIVADAMEAYGDGLAEYEDGRKEFDEAIADAEKEIADAEAEINDGQKQLDDGIKKLEDGQKELDEQKAAAEEELEKGRKELEDGQKQLEEGRKEYEKTAAELAGTIKEIDDGIQQLQEAQQGLTQLRQLQTILHDPRMQETVNSLRRLPDSMKQMTITELIDRLETLQGGLQQLQNQLDTPAVTPGEILSAAAAARQELQHDRTVLQNNQDQRNALAAMPAGVVPPAGTISSDTTQILSAWCPDLPQTTAGEILTAWQETENRMNQAGAALESSDTQAVLNALAAMDPDADLSVLGEIDLESVRSMYAQLNAALDTGSQINTVGDLINQYATLVQMADNAEADAERQLREQGVDPDHIDVSIAELQAAKKQITDGLADGKKQLDEAEAELKAGSEKLAAGEQELLRQTAEAQQIIDDGWLEIEENRKKLDEGRQKLADAKREFTEKKQDGEQELDDAKAELDKAWQDIQDLETGSWTVLDRSQHYASATYDSTIDQMKAIANIFPVFFILVAALVCLTTMTRMVAEQRGQIGIMRALGYSRLQCAAKYLVYAAMATGIGILLGCVIGLATFPAVIYHTWRMMYILPVMKLKIPWGLIGTTSAAFLIIMVWTTWSACRADMVEVPAQLMRPKAPRMGRKTLLEHLGILWNRLSFTGKVTVRNLIRYKKRFFMTVLGVAGCAALLVTGFGVRDSINSMVDLQFYELMKMDGTAKLAEDTTVSEAIYLSEQVRSRDDVAAVVLAGSYSAQSYDRTNHDETVFAQVFDEEEMQRVYLLRTRRGHHEIVPTDDGVIISEKFAENHDLSVGDTFTLESITGLRREVRVSAVMEMYIHHYVLMTSAYYREVFGTTLRDNTLFIKAAEDGTALQEAIVAMNGISEVEFNDVTLENFRTMVKGIDAVVWVLIVSSMSLAFVVLGNLTNVNISERQREIATLKVLGFRPREVQSYIYKENNILTAIGALAGLPLGNVLHHYIMRQVEMNYVMFGRSVKPVSFILAWLLTMVFGLIVNRSMNRRLQQIEMVESLKSVE